MAEFNLDEVWKNVQKLAIDQPIKITVEGQSFEMDVAIIGGIREHGKSEAIGIYAGPRDIDEFGLALLQVFRGCFKAFKQIFEVDMVDAVNFSYEALNEAVRREMMDMNSSELSDFIMKRVQQEMDKHASK